MTMMTTFADGIPFPLLGMGVMKIADDAVPAAMLAAVSAGYRAFDTAPVYANEIGVGNGMRDCGLERADIAITTKLWNARQGYDETLRAFDDSLAALGLDYIDLYLIHWPVPKLGRYLDSWRALIRLQEEGRARAIGVSNFTVAHLDRIIGETGVVPAINQIELHPRWQQPELRAYHERHGIVTQAWSPLGRGSALDNPPVTEIAAAINRSPSQVILRWLTQLDIVVIPKASSAGHLRENIASFDFTLDDQAMATMAKLHAEDGRFGPHPDAFEMM